MGPVEAARKAFPVGSRWEDRRPNGTHSLVVVGHALDLSTLGAFVVVVANGHDDLPIAFPVKRLAGVVREPDGVPTVGKGGAA
jgi:hypothetical protein